ncbi:hypothetical protein F4823DRAFT_585781 [Ustulina deusta]|nr:hypothetical protein F4823DRAFT_585781 [Ustulina deusta]
MKAGKALSSEALALLRQLFGRPTGWKQAATVNCILLFAISIVLVGFLIPTAVEARGIGNPVFFYEGPCKENGVSDINFFLHLLINILSTLVLASTNFFMQILNAPTRKEIDVAHLNGTWLEIGVSSARNIFKISKFKTCCWLGFLISSIPIHLLSNSTVFTTEYRESNFNLTIATDEFLNGGSFFPPGASLLLREGIGFGYGIPGTAEDYADKESAVMRYISSVADRSRNWDRIDVSDCLEKYLTNCNGLDRHRDLILVVDKTGGWTRNEMWQLLEPASDAEGYYYPSYWDHLVPANVSNHLFYDAACVMAPGSPPCSTDCTAALGGYETNDQHIGYVGSPYPFFRGEERGYDIHPTLRPGSDNISIQYCLADPLESRCHVGLSTTLLFAVTLSVVAKTGIALLVTTVLSRQCQSPLVTTGDSIASFLEKPDASTAGCAGLDLNKNSIHIGPKKWQVVNKRRWVVVPISIWITSYLLFAISIAVCIYFLEDLSYRSLSALRSALRGGFFASNTNPFIGLEFTLLTGILTANSPQLLLSAAYLAYNSLFTRLQVAQEWAMYGTDYYPLRVTDPQGMQRSTYRLQLPYKYSLPLIAVSVFLHFLLSNTIYVVVSFGGYLKVLYGSVDSEPGLPADSTVLIGYSPLSLLVLLIVTTILVTIPIILSLKKLPPNIAIVGANSQAISAACHASSLSQAVLYTQTQNIHSDGDEINDDGLTETQQRQSNEYADMELASMLRNHDTASIEGDNASVASNIGVLGRIARSKIRWGVVKMPPEWYETFVEDDEVGHLSFGVEKDEVLPPEPGRWYV